MDDYRHSERIYDTNTHTKDKTRTCCSCPKKSVAVELVVQSIGFGLNHLSFFLFYSKRMDVDQSFFSHFKKFSIYI